MIAQPNAIIRPARAVTLPAPIALPAPRVAVSVRAGTMEDLPFIDALQKQHSKQLGFMHRATLEGKIRLGHVLVAEGDEPSASGNEPRPSGSGSGVGGADESGPLPHGRGSLAGYVIGNDQYFKRDDVGCIFQLCTVPEARRSLVGAALVKAMFDRAAYGCRLFCCWCAQDIEANRFWESLGFVPLAYRAGSEKKGKGGSPRVHIFWQKRIRADDTSTPWWFPAKTDAGSIREDRLVLPIPPGLHWSEPMPVITPQQQAAAPPLPSPEDGSEPKRRARAKAAPALVPGTIASPREPTPHPKKRIRASFGPPPVHAAPVEPEPKPVAPEPKPAREKPRREKRKADPKLLAAARELRDRFLEHVAEEPELILPAGKYEVARALPESPDQRHAVPRLVETEVKALPAAA